VHLDGAFKLHIWPGVGTLNENQINLKNQMPCYVIECCWLALMTLTLFPGTKQIRKKYKTFQKII
jgi:hypothetical protein